MPVKAKLLCACFVSELRRNSVKEWLMSCKYLVKTLFQNDKIHGERRRSGCGISMSVGTFYINSFLCGVLLERG